ncbi:protein Niban 2-like [Rhinophrynus dorsalis]
MGDVLSSHLDEGRRHYITDRTGKLLTEFGKLYEEQYGVALFNSVRYEIEGNGGPQTQLLHRKSPLKDRVIFSGNLFQYLDDTKKWRNRFCLVPHHYSPVIYDNNVAYERGLQPRAGINCAGYRVLTSLEQYSDLLNASVPGGKVKTGSGQMKCATPFLVILWHPYCRHYMFCVMNEREQQKWSAVFQDCVRHCNNGISEDSRVESAAFTDSVRLFRQARDHYGTWDMLCGNQVQVLSNLVMEELIPDLKNIICPKLRGKPQERQRAWLLISDTVYRMVHEQTRLFYEGLEKSCTERRPEMESQIRTDMDQIIACKEHVSNKIRATVLPKAELCVRNHVQSHIPSILEALMAPTSQGFSEVRDLLFKETTELNMNLVNEGGRDKLGEQMEKLSQLAYHPVKMQPCYEKMDQLNLEGLQQRFDVGSPAVFRQRGQILMREQTDNAVYTFEQMVHQELSKSDGGENLCRDIQRILERVLKKYDYDSSSVRKKFFQEALLQIIIPFLLKKLAPTCKADLPRYQELIFEELSRFVLVENTYEEVVLQTVMRDIVQAVKDAATQRKHNLFRDSMVMHNSDPNLHLLGEGPPIDWSEEYANPNESSSENRHARLHQVVSIIQEDEGPELVESCQETPSHEGIQEEPESSDVAQIRGMLVKEFNVEVPNANVNSQPKSDVISSTIKEVAHGDQAKPELLRTGDGQGLQEEDVAQENVVDSRHLAQDEEEAKEYMLHSHSPQEDAHMVTQDEGVAKEYVLHSHSPHREAQGDVHVAHEEDHMEIQAPREEATQDDVTVVHSPERTPEHLAYCYHDLSEVGASGNKEDTDDKQPTAPREVEHEDKELSQTDRGVEHASQEVAPDNSTQEEDNSQNQVQALPRHIPKEVPATVLYSPEEESHTVAEKPSPAPVAHSMPDDSGFQSPMSEEEEEGEGYREIPVPAPRKRDEIITQF